MENYFCMVSLYLLTFIYNILCYVSRGIFKTWLQYGYKHLRRVSDILRFIENSLIVICYDTTYKVYMYVWITD